MKFSWYIKKALTIIKLKINMYLIYHFKKKFLLVNYLFKFINKESI